MNEKTIEEKNLERIKDIIDNSISCYDTDNIRTIGNYLLFMLKHEPDYRFGFVMAIIDGQIGDK